MINVKIFYPCKLFGNNLEDKVDLNKHVFDMSGFIGGTEVATETDSNSEAVDDSIVYCTIVFKNSVTYRWGYNPRFLCYLVAKFFIKSNTVITSQLPDLSQRMRISPITAMECCLVFRYVTAKSVVFF